MLSIVVCSINPVLFDSLKGSIEKTIGLTDYELIKIDNNVEKLSIAKAYNKGLSQAKNDIVVFIHEDVIFHTNGWGKILMYHFNSDPRIGLIGVAGSTIKLKAPSSWFNHPVQFHVKNIIQHKGDNGVRQEKIGWDGNNGILRKIAVADGVFLALRNMNGVSFDERIPGFHGYDLAISIIYQTHGLSVFATNKILIEHFSTGVLDKSWIRAMYVISRLYKDHLPIALQKVSGLKNLELEMLKWFAHRSLDLNERKIAFFCFTRLISIQPLSFQNMVIFKRLLFK